MTPVIHTPQRYIFKGAFLSCLLCGFLLASCVDERDSSASSGLPVVFTPSLWQANSSGTVSRAANDSWHADDRIGIYMAIHNATPGASADLGSALSSNVEYKTPSAGTSSALVAVSDVIRYPTDGSSVNFVAYYPYLSTVHTTYSDVYPVNVGSSDGTTQQILPEIDLLYHKGTGIPYDRTSSDVSLDFTHQLSKLIISITTASGVTTDLSDSPALSISGMPATAGFDLSSGSLTGLGGTATAIVPALDSSSNTTSSALWEAIIVPHEGSDAHANGRVFTFSFGGADYTYTLPAARSFVSGRAYHYNFTLTASGLALTQNTIVDWDGGTIAWGGNLLTATKTVFNVTDAGENVESGVALQVDFNTTATTAAFTVPTSLLSDAETIDKPDWLTPSLSSGSVSNGWLAHTLTFACERNIRDVVRTGYILAQVDGLTIAVTVNQAAGPGLFVTPSTTSLTANYKPQSDLSFTFETNSVKAASAMDVVFSNNSTVPDTSDVPSWITGTSAHPELIDTDSDGVSTYRVSFGMLENEDDVNDRVAYAYITVEGVTQKVTITQKKYVRGVIMESANCIILQTEGAPALIPVKIANDAATYTGVSAGRNDGYVAPFATSGNISFEAKVLWVDAPSFATGSRIAASAADIIAEVEAVCAILDESYLFVAPGTKEGNAVVCITKPGTDEIIWSWHIWVVGPADRALLWVRGNTEENTLTSKPAATANNYAFMPLHLGAFNSAGNGTAWAAATGWSGHPFAGLYYQWGRKDPITNRAQPSWMGSGLSSSGLPYISNVTAFVANTTASYTGMKSIQYPYSFNWGSNATTGWQGTIHLTGITNNSWGYASSTYNATKSPFDPCPAGWRVPPGYNSAGADWTGNAWKTANTNKGTWTTNHAYGINGYPLTNYGGFHPAAGNRYGSTSFSNGGSNGYYWSAGPHTSTVSNGYYMYFNSSTLNEGNDYATRRNGFSVRCVAE